MRRSDTLITTLLALLASLAPLGAASPGSDRLPRLLDELRRTGGGRHGCFEHEPSVLGKDDANVVAAGYQQSRGLADAASSRVLLADLVEYVLRPGSESFERLRRGLDTAGPNFATTEDVCRCVYFDGREDRVEQMASMPLPAVGEFWAGRVLHEAGRTEGALSHYRLALEAHASDPRTRLFYAIALTPRLWEAYGQRFGTTYPMSLPDIAFDREHQRALIRYNFGWRGGSLLAARKDGRWTITPRGNWIT